MILRSGRRRLGAVAAGIAATCLLAGAASAGPPYATDDPEPTDLGHSEIFAFSALAGAAGERSAAAGLDLNYGLVEDLQLTATVPLGFERGRGSGRWSGGIGDLELAAKYRFFNDPKRGRSVAVFPRVILPTGRAGSGRTRLSLPMWGQQDAGKWSLFGGGGFELNPGEGQRNFWQAGLAVTRDMGRGVSLGGEVTHQGRDADDAEAETALGLGSIIHLRGPFSWLVSGGPTFTRSTSGFRAYSALGIAF